MYDNMPSFIEMVVFLAKMYGAMLVVFGCAFAVSVLVLRIIGIKWPK